MITTQDTVKGLDLSVVQGQVTGSALNQLVDLARLAADKGMLILTDDTGINLPSVPDPDGTYDGINPTWWKRYLWLRNVNIGINTFTKILYWWNSSLPSDQVFLQWERVDKDYLTLQNQIDAVNNIATQASADAASAQASADAAADVAAQAAQQAEVANQLGSSNDIEIKAISAAITHTLWQRGDYRDNAILTVYSKVVDQGWLLCDGSEALISAFPNLAAGLGTTFGIPSDANYFVLPNFCGKVAGTVGSGGKDGAGLTLTPRNIGDNVGEEKHLQISTEVAAHQHQISVETSGTQGAQTDHKMQNVVWQAVADTDKALSDANDVSGQTKMNVMQPTLFAGYRYIKT